MTMTRWKFVTVGMGLAALVVTASCGSGVEGTYGDNNSPMKIVLKGGGKAAVTFMNQTKDCTYTTDKKKISLDCKEGSPLELTLSDDGKELQLGGGGAGMPSLKKQ